VDQETFIALKTEHRELDGSVSFRQAATEFTASPNIPESMFVYEPPEGVTVVEVADLGEAKQAIVSVPPEPSDGGVRASRRRKTCGERVLNAHAQSAERRSQMEAGAFVCLATRAAGVAISRLSLT